MKLVKFSNHSKFDNTNKWSGTISSLSRLMLADASKQVDFLTLFWTS